MSVLWRCGAVRGGARVLWSKFVIQCHLDVSPCVCFYGVGAIRSALLRCFRRLGSRTKATLLDVGLQRVPVLVCDWRASYCLHSALVSVPCMQLTHVHVHVYVAPCFIAGVCSCRQLPEQFEDIPGSVAQLLGSALSSGDAESAAYWAYHLSRTTFFLGAVRA